jgi:WD40 repeat protein
MRHSSPVRAFDFNYDYLDLVICGQNDGTVTAWNTKLNYTIMSVLPDPTWSSKNANIQSWDDIEKHHTGAILAARVSANGLFLATGSEDYTCKLWYVLSLRKDPNELAKEEEARNLYHSRLNGCINVLDESLGDQLQFKEYTHLKMGEAPFSNVQSIDLRFTFIHDAPVLAVRFSSESNVLVTGSLDSTCKIWSTKSGNQLFQINLPGPISHIYIDYQSNIYCGCQNRIVVFNAQFYSKDHELPIYWQDAEIKSTIQRSLIEETHQEKELTHQEKVSSMESLKNEISSSLYNLFSEYPEIDTGQIYRNMRLVLLFKSV